LSRPAEHVCERLAELKVRSGRSYEWLAQRTHTSKSSVQRYCTGRGVPPTFGLVESIALACGAGTDEVAELFRLWTRAVATPPEPYPEPTVGQDPAPDQQAAPDQAGGSGQAADRAERDSPEAGSDVVKAGPQVDGVLAEFALPVAGLSVQAEPKVLQSVSATADPELITAPGPGAFGRWSRPRGHLAILLVVLVVVLVTVGAFGGLTNLRSRARTPTAAQIRPIPMLSADPAWSRPSSGVSSRFFGVTLNSTSGAVPEFKVGAVRLWDSGTRWAQFEPERGRFNWAALDRHVQGAQRAGLPVLFVFGGTPRWANPDAPASAYPDGGRAAAPLDLTDWDDAVRAVVQRYQGRIESYEIWPLGNDPRYFNGSVATLVDLSRRAGRIIRATDPEATIVCPGMGNLWTLEGQNVLRRFAEAGGYDQCDVASIKLYQQKAVDPPETMLQLATTVDRLLHDAGVQPRIWVTGTTYAITDQPALDPVTARSYAVRYYLTGLYARTLNIERMYFYNWGGKKLPLVLQAEGQPPTAAALAVDRLQRWLTGAKSTACGHGPEAGLPAAVWQCRFLLPGKRSGAHALSIRWTLSGSTDTTAGPDDLAVQTLDGRRTPLRSGDRIALSTDPVLIEQTG
jgi:hypothetical protein